MPRSCSLLTALILTAAGCAHEQRRGAPIVRDLDIEGNRAVEDDELKARIVTSESSWLPFTEPQPFDPNIWRTDLRRIERYYQERGYYQARVVSDQVRPIGDDVALTIRVREGEPTYVTRVEVRGLEALPPEHRELVTDEIPIQEREIFLEEEWSGLKERLARTLRDVGYVQAQVSGEARVDLETRRAQVDIGVAPGRRYRFGEIEVRLPPGDRVEPWRIEEQVREAIEDEDFYSERARAEAEARVVNLGVFGAVRVSPGVPNEEAGTVPLVAEAQSSTFRSLRAGLGIGLEQGRTDFHVVGGFVHRDFLGGLRRLELEARVGWAFLPSFYSVLAPGGIVTQSGPIAQVSAGLTQPRLLSPNFSLDGRLEVEREIEPTFRYYGGRSELGLIWRPRTWLAIRPSYHFELYQLEAGEAVLEDTSPTLLFGCPSRCVLSYLEQVIELDRRDDAREPTRGYLLLLSLQEGGGPLGGSFRYLRVTPEARGYFTPDAEPRVTLSARVRVGTLIPASGEPLDSPIVARFFSGGSGMRGFGARRLSPMILVERREPRGEINADPQPIGGNGLFESQLELRYAVTEKLLAAAFIDVGFVTTDSIPLLRPRFFFDNALIAVGGGLRYLTPIGPIRLDLAFRPNVGPALPVFQPEGRVLTYEIHQGCFGIGGGARTGAGAPEGPCAIHLSIGEAF